jgi:hypothetical protein
MATLPTILVNGDSVNGPRNWTTQTYLNIDEPIASADTARAEGPSKVNDADTSFLLANTPSDLSTMDTLSWRLVYYRYSTTDDTVGLQIRIVTETGGTVLAAADSGGTFHQVVANGREGVSPNGNYITSGVTAFPYVNTTATKAQWDDARVELRQTYAQNMGADTAAVIMVDTLEITGTYTASGGAPTVQSGMIL